MIVENRMENDILIVKIDGPLDHFTNHEFKETVDLIFEEQNITKAVFDMEKCTKLRSAGNG